MPRPLTPLALAVLRMLCERPMHPYEMRQRIRDYHYDAAVKVTHGSLYHTVERLAENGLIEPLETSREGRRPERTVYAVTGAGRDSARDRLAEMIARPVQEFPALNTALALIDLLPEAEAADLLRQRALLLEGELAAHNAVYDSLLKQGLDRWKLLDLEYHLTVRRTELDHVRALLEDLRTGRLTWGNTGCATQSNDMENA